MSDPIVRAYRNAEIDRRILGIAIARELKVYLRSEELPRKAMPHIRTILHPSDLAETSQAAFQLARSMAIDYSAELIALHVYPPPFNEADAVDRDRSNEVQSDLMAALRKFAAADDRVRMDYRLEEGTASEVILEQAQNCDLIVMGTHGREGLGRAIMGSVAERVLREATCPVVTVRPSARLPEEYAEGLATGKRIITSEAEVEVSG
jgi:nucleotide-binding universal stress UspA family protein